MEDLQVAVQIDLFSKFKVCDTSVCSLVDVPHQLLSILKRNWIKIQDTSNPGTDALPFVFIIHHEVCEKIVTACREFYNRTRGCGILSFPHNFFDEEKPDLHDHLLRHVTVKIVAKPITEWKSFINYHPCACRVDLVRSRLELFALPNYTFTTMFQAPRLVYDPKLNEVGLVTNAAFNLDTKDEIQLKVFEFRKWSNVIVNSHFKGSTFVFLKPSSLKDGRNTDVGEDTDCEPEKPIMLKHVLAHHDLRSCLLQQESKSSSLFDVEKRNRYSVSDGFGFKTDAQDLCSRKRAGSTGVSSHLPVKQRRRDDLKVKRTLSVDRDAGGDDMSRKAFVHGLFKSESTNNSKVSRAESKPELSPRQSALRSVNSLQNDFLRFIDWAKSIWKNLDFDDYSCKVCKKETRKIEDF